MIELVTSPTSQQVFDKGCCLDHYPCDKSQDTGECESNGSVEALYEFEGKGYYIYMPFDLSRPLNPDEPAYLAYDDIIKWEGVPHV